MIWQCSEWQGASGIWYCNCTQPLSTSASCWYTPARILGVSPADFIKLVINKFGADQVKYFPDSCFFSYGWSDQSKMRKFKKYINAEARKRNFLI